MNSETHKFRNSSIIAAGMKRSVTQDEGARGPGRPRCEEARQRILTAAAEILEEVGFAEATVDAIADRAGASKATVYRWWPHKAAVLIEAFRESVAGELPFAITGDLEADLRKQLAQFGAMLRGRKGRAFAGFIAGAQSDPDLAEEFRNSWIHPRREEAKHVLRHYVETGDLPRGIDLDLSIELLYAPLYYRLLTGYGELTDEFAETVARQVLHGLKAR
jgi:AcrR family transcriptional regulator